jgi:hypothetical protein
MRIIQSHNLLRAAWEVKSHVDGPEDVKVAAAVEVAHDEVGKAEEMRFARDFLSNQYGVAVG